MLRLHAPLPCAPPPTARSLRRPHASAPPPPRSLCHLPTPLVCLDTSASTHPVRPPTAVRYGGRPPAAATGDRSPEPPPTAHRWQPPDEGIPAAMSKLANQAPSDMEVDSVAAAEEKNLVRFSINGNFLFTVGQRAAAAKAEAHELTHRAVRCFADIYAAAEASNRDAIDVAMRHLYTLDLKACYRQWRRNMQDGHG